MFANCFVFKWTVTRLKCMGRLRYFFLNNVSEQTTDLHVIWDAMMLTWRFYVMTSSNLHTIIRIYDFVTYKQIDGASKLIIWCIHFIWPLQWRLMSVTPFQITDYSTVCPAIMAICGGILRSPIDSHHEGPVRRKTFPCHDFVMHNGHDG